ncbi:MAG: hypothetical protein CMD15_02750 [Flavobacteriales bacterium]|nr:hypothetical protein [Flavobacteriales bacterium]|tara:strand:+ start:2704 stop:4422 length:1719 start_codon:yes stop_codon:yes gene_type:complete
MINDRRKEFTKFIKNFSSIFKAKNTLLISSNYTEETSKQSSERPKDDFYRNVQGWVCGDLLNFKHNSSVSNFDNLEFSNNDLIVADLPLNLGKKEPYHFDKLKKVFRSWNILISLLQNMTDNGTLLVILPTTIMHNRGVNLLKDLREHGYYCNIILNIPERINPQTGIKTYLLGFQKKITDKQFIAQIEVDYDNKTNNYQNIISNYQLRTDEDFINGFWEERLKFISFSHYIFQRKFEVIRKYYKNYKELKVSEIILKDGINIISRGKFEDIKDAIYIKSIGKISVQYKYDEIEKHQNYIQLIINTQIVSSKFLSFFYMSELGVEILKSLKKGLTLERIYQEDLLSSLVLIPSINEQDSFIDAHEKLTKLEDSIQSLKNELSLNPNTKNEVLLKWEKLHLPFVKLTKADEIRRLITEGENKKIEFKETLILNIHTKKADPEIEKSVLKNIVAFFNSDGGTLLIGVDDNGKIIGVEKDKFNNKDRYLLHLNNLIKDKIGTAYFSLINYELVEIDSKLVLLIECKESKEPIYLKTRNGEEYYIRTNPSAIQLQASSLIAYVEQRKKKFRESLDK